MMSTDVSINSHGLSMEGGAELMITANSMAHYPKDNQPKLDVNVLKDWTLGPKLSCKFIN